MSEGLALWAGVVFWTATTGGVILAWLIQRRRRRRRIAEIEEYVRAATCAGLQKPKQYVYYEYVAVFECPYCKKERWQCWHPAAHEAAHEDVWCPRCRRLFGVLMPGGHD